MYRLTDRRLDAARPILDKYAEQLRKTRSIASMVLERELREVWDIGYQELKDVMIEMLDHEPYRLIAAYYMQHQNGPGPVSEFKPHLTELYGTRMYDPFDKEGKQAAFWESALGPGKKAQDT